MKDDGPLVLVVDDHPESAEMLASLLELDGYATAVAFDAEAALKICHEQGPLCALIDIEMPGTSGIELSRQMRKRFSSDLVLIAVTGWGRKDERVSAQFECFDFYMRKPVSPDELRKILPPVNI